MAKTCDFFRGSRSNVQNVSNVQKIFSLWIQVTRYIKKASLQSAIVKPLQQGA